MECKKLEFKTPDEMPVYSLVDSIIETLQCYGLDIGLLVGQEYDRASVMAGIHGRVQKLMKERIENAYYVH